MQRSSQTPIIEVAQFGLTFNRPDVLAAAFALWRTITI
jgi:hypothetical protein